MDDNAYFNEWLAAEIKRLDEAVIDIRRSATERDLMSQRAIRQSNENLDRRVEALNEFRAQLAAQQVEYITRREYEAKHDSLTLQFSTLGQAISDIQRTAAWTTGRMVGAVGVITFVVSIFLAIIFKFV